MGHASCGSTSSMAPPPCITHAGCQCCCSNCQTALLRCRREQSAAGCPPAPRLVAAPGPSAGSAARRSRTRGPVGDAARAESGLRPLRLAGPGACWGNGPAQAARQLEYCMGEWHKYRAARRRLGVSQATAGQRAGVLSLSGCDLRFAFVRADTGKAKTVCRASPGCWAAQALLCGLLGSLGFVMQPCSLAWCRSQFNPRR